MEWYYEMADLSWINFKGFLFHSGFEGDRKLEFVQVLVIDVGEESNSNSNISSEINN